MRDMTKEEYDALDERLTKTVPTLGHTGTGYFTRRKNTVLSVIKPANAEEIAMIDERMKDYENDPSSFAPLKH